jgi:hypothetical protein
MTKRRTTMSKRKVTQAEVDRIVTEQAAEESAWERPVVVSRPKWTSLALPAELAARATFLAKLHRERGVDRWIERVVRERVEIEESAFRAAKKTVAS